MIEKHFCLDRKIKNPDSAFSMEPDEFAEMVRSAGNAASARGKVTYEPTPREIDARWCRRSLFAGRDIGEGETFSPDNIRVIRPAYGLESPNIWDDVLGKKMQSGNAAGNAASMGRRSKIGVQGFY